jgi:hypothetical protein
VDGRGDVVAVREAIIAAIDPAGRPREIFVFGILVIFQCRATRMRAAAFSIIRHILFDDSRFVDR